MMGSIGLTNHALQRQPMPARSIHLSAGSSLALTFLIFGLVLLGLLFVYSASYSRAFEQTGDPNFFLTRQLIALGAGLVIFLICIRIPYQFWLKVDTILLLGAGLLTLATLIPGIALNGRWIDLGPTNLQPTEVLKVALLIYMAASLYRREDRIKEFSQGVWPHILVAGAAALIAIKQPDFGMALMFLSITFFLLFIGGARLKHLGGMLLLGIPPLALLMIAAPYRLARLLSFLDPYGNASNGGYQIIQSWVSLGSGGLLGRGLGAGVEKLGYLPAAHTDFIFSVMGEELGMFGTMMILIGFFVLGWLGFSVALNCKNRFAQLLAAGLTFALCWQALLNVGVAVGVLPVTGLTLPFISYGGSSLLASLAMGGILINLARTGGRA
jgi:cell division protein FtsW